MSQRYSSSILKIEKEADTPRSTHICQQTAVTIYPYPSPHVPHRFLDKPFMTIETAQKWITLPGKNNKQHKFPVQTILPKVQLTRYVPPKTLPLDVEVDRRRRQYAKQNLEEMLDKAGVTLTDLLPTAQQYYQLTETKFEHFLPLNFFDDSDFDCHSEEAWLKLGVVDGEQYPLPAKAFLPTNQNLMDYSWQNAAISAYDAGKDLWTALTLSDESYYEVPKVQIMFFAENGAIFVQRIQKAVQARNCAESVLMMEAIVDCVLLQDLNDKSFYRNEAVDRTIEKVCGHADEVFLCGIQIEVYLVFEHLMACYEFDKFVKMMPKEFPTFGGTLILDTLPKAFPSKDSESERRMLKALKLDIKDLRYKVLAATLFYIATAIEAMMNVVKECEHVEKLSMFVCSFAKPLPLNDFLQSQQQQSNNVSSYIKNFWPTKVSVGICIVLRPQGKGWLDISLKTWSVYKMCKIIRFILQTKFRMQESMQIMLEKSIETFSHFLCAPCLQFLDLTEDYKWTKNYIDTEFPHSKPVFSLILNISEEDKVFYSTNPEEFEPSLMEIFKKALEKTSGVRCIDAETMGNLRFAPNLYILTVELIEDMYLQKSDLMHRCYKKAVYPLLSYAKKYERFIPFYILNVSDYLKEYEKANKPSAQVKADILEHKRQKEELREILPASITIGPFVINTDILKQYMIKKHIDIVKRLFEYYVQRMYNINENLLERCLGIYNKISERPQSIEHLYEIRDFALTVPDLVEDLKADIQIMWLEYEILDSFYYNLTDAQFAMKWEVYAWPHNIMQRSLTLREEQKLDIEEFRRLHLSECAGLEERLESLNEEIQAFSLIFDPTKAYETAVEVKKTWRIIAELQKQGAILQYRQKLFDLEYLSLEFLDSIISGFMPYRNLWTACLEFCKLEEATEGNPIALLDLADIWQNLSEIRKTLNNSVEIFSEKPEVQNVALTYLHRINEFEPVYHCITWLRNENWLFLHWQELGSRSGMEIKYSAALNFIYLRRKGIMEHLELVHDISVKAESDAEAIRLAWEEEERRKEDELQALLRRKQMRKCRTDIL